MVSNTNLDNNSHREYELKRPQMTSNDLKTTSNKPVKNKENKLTAGFSQKDIEINDEYLDGMIHNNSI